MRALGGSIRQNDWSHPSSHMCMLGASRTGGSTECDRPEEIPMKSNDEAGNLTALSSQVHACALVAVAD